MTALTIAIGLAVMALSITLVTVPLILFFYWIKGRKIKKRIPTDMLERVEDEKKKWKEVLNARKEKATKDAELTAIREAERRKSQVEKSLTPIQNGQSNNERDVIPDTRDKQDDKDRGSDKGDTVRRRRRIIRTRRK